MADDQNDHPHEIIIIKRRHDADHDEPHGGVWKVAFADFMTAMMAFFLVLWIVNSTSKDTRASVARYFNPVQLSDTTPARKGLQDPRAEDFDASVKAAAGSGKPSKEPAPKPEHQPAPADARDAVAAKSPADTMLAPSSRQSGMNETLVNAPALAEPGIPSSRNPASDAFRDPFAIAPVAAAPDSAAAMQSNEITFEKAASGNQAADPGKVERLKANLASIAAETGKAGPGMALRETPEGILISLTDKFDFSMFGAGSAEPNTRLATVMAGIAGALKTFDGGVVIRGHTDARPFRSAADDNWRLSSARAQMTLYLLVQAGFPENRIERIEGHADHALLNSGSPEAAENRRIEILVRKPAR